MASYSTHCCLDCEYSSKRSGICPNCRKELLNMGKKFRPPRKGQKNKWNTIRTLIAGGFRFGSCYGNCCIQAVPKTLGAAKRFIRDKLNR